MLSFVPGDAVTAPAPPWGLTDAALRSVGELLRRFHDAAASFDPSPYTGRTGRRHRTTRGGMPHNDPNLDNFVFRDGRAVALIDFDLAAPGRPAVGRGGDRAAVGAAALAGGRGRRAAGPGAARARILVDAYGLDDAGTGRAGGRRAGEPRVDGAGSSPTARRTACRASRPTGAPTPPPAPAAPTPGWARTPPRSRRPSSPSEASRHSRHGESSFPARRVVIFGTASRRSRHGESRDPTARAIRCVRGRVAPTPRPAPAARLPAGRCSRRRRCSPRSRCSRCRTGSGGTGRTPGCRCTPRARPTPGSERSR